MRRVKHILLIISNIFNGIKRKIKRRWRKFIDPFYREYIFKFLYPRIYYKNAKKPVDENKIVFVEIRLPELTNSFRYMYDYLSDNFDFDIHCHYLRNNSVGRKQYRKNCKAMVADIATAKYVFFNEATNVIGLIKMREETEVIQLWHGCGAFKKFGFSTAEMKFGASKEMMEKYPYNKNYTLVTVSSPEVVWAYEEAMRYTPESGVIQPLGSSRTDVFFDKEFIKTAFYNLHNTIPVSENKKIILYAPTFRGSVENTKTPDILDVSEMKKALKDDYILLIKHHPLVKKRPEIIEECRDFAFDVTDLMKIEDLICVSDICITDYSSLVFEYSLFERPIIFLAYDLDEYFDNRGFYYDYNEFSPGPVVKTTEDIISYISDIENQFDKDKVIRFKEKFMSACDGHSTERIVNRVFLKNNEKLYN